MGRNTWKKVCWFETHMQGSTTEPITLYEENPIEIYREPTPLEEFDSHGWIPPFSKIVKHIPAMPKSDLTKGDRKFLDDINFEGQEEGLGGFIFNRTGGSYLMSVCIFYPLGAWVGMKRARNPILQQYPKKVRKTIVINMMTRYASRRIAFVVFNAFALTFSYSMTSLIRSKRDDFSYLPAAFIIGATLSTGYARNLRNVYPRYPLGLFGGLMGVLIGIPLAMRSEGYTLS